MNKYLFMASAVILIFLSICLIYARQIILPEGVYVNEERNTDGTLSFTVRTVSYGGPYAPRNAGVIWITNSSNQFVKTLKIWAQTYRYTLVKWLANSGNNTTGAITSASLNTHQLHTVTWNGANISNNQTPDGTYNVNVEFTEHNASNSNPGKFKTLTFTKGPNQSTITPPNESYFANMLLTWTPSAPAPGTISGTVRDSNYNPINGALITVGALTATTNISGYYSLYLQPGTYSVRCEAPNYGAQYSYDIVVVSNQVTNCDFILSATSNNEDVAQPGAVILYQNYPNPFVASTSVKYYLNKTIPVRITIYNAKGELVKNILQKDSRKGLNQYDWDGMSDGGQRLRSGKYILKLNADGKTYIKVMSRID
jgi:flagellar hook assembly protein FlgD